MNCYGDFLLLDASIEVMVNTSSAIDGMNNHQKTGVVAKSPEMNIQKSNI